MTERYGPLNRTLARVTVVDGAYALGVGLFLAVLIIPAGLLAHDATADRLRHHGRPAIAQVQEVSTTRSGDYRAKVRYDTSTGPVSSTVTIPGASQYRYGAARGRYVDVVYDAEHPSTARLAGNIGGVTLGSVARFLLALLSACFLILGSSLVFQGIRRSLRSRRTAGRTARGTPRSHAPAGGPPADQGPGVTGDAAGHGDRAPGRGTGPGSRA